MAIVLLTSAACSPRPGLSVEAGIATATLPIPTPTAVDPPPSPSPEVTVTPAPADVPTTSPSPTPLPAATPASFVCPFLHGRTEIGTVDSAAMGEQARYLVHLPPCYDSYPDRAFPVLYLFHGWPMNEWHWVNLGVDTWSDDWVSRGITGPYIVVMPGVSQDGLYVNSSGGDSSFEGFVANELVPHIDSLYRTIRAPSGRAVGGISRGGVWSLEIGMRHQDLFGAVGGHSPALALNRPLPQYDPYLLAGEGVQGLRIYLDAGDADWSRAGTIRLRDLLIELDANVVYQVHTGGHVDALWSSGLPDYLAFYAGAWPRSYEALPEWQPAPAGGGTDAAP